MTKEIKSKKGDGIIGWGVGYFIVSIVAFFFMLKEEYLLALGVEVLIIGLLTMLVLLGIGYVIKEINLLRMDLDKYFSKKEKS